MKKTLLLLTACLIYGMAQAQWAPVNNGLTTLSQGVRTITGHNGKMYTGTLTGFKLYTSSDYGNNWTEIGVPVLSGIPVSTLSYGNRLFFGLNTVGDDVYYTDNDGTTWTAASGGPQSTEVRGFYTMSNGIFCYTSNRGIYRSIDGGSNWSTVNNGLTNFNVVKLERIGSRILACTIGGGVFVSDDNGDNWTQSNSGISSSNLAGNLLWRLGNDFFYIDQASAIYKSTDQGNSWSPFTSPSFWRRPALIYRNETSGRLYMKSRVTFGNDSLFVTADEGVTWTNITGNLVQNYNEAAITEYDGYVFYAYDILAANLGIYRNGIFSSISDISNLEFDLYPVPTSDVLHIHFPSKKNQNLLIQVKNQLGQNIINSIFQKTSASSSDLSIFTAGLPEGIYFLEVSEGEGRFTKKFVIAGR